MFSIHIHIIKILLRLRTFIDTLKAIARKLSLPQRETEEMYIYMRLGLYGAGPVLGYT